MKKGESQKFWINLLQNVVCMPAATGYIVFEERIKFDHTSFIDVYINTTCCNNRKTLEKTSEKLSDSPMVYAMPCLHL